MASISSGSNSFYYLHTDHLGSTTSLSSSAVGGGLISGSTTRYYPFGAWRTAPTQTLTDRGYTGHLENMEIGLVYMRARYYVPSIGRFASADTMVPDASNPQSFNRYSYVGNSPICFNDPDGHCWPLCTAAIGAIGGAIIGAAVAAVPQIVANVRDSQPLLTNIDPAQVANAAIVGAAAGAVGGATFGVGTAIMGTGFAATVGSGAISGVVAGQAARATDNVLSGASVTQGLGRPADMAIDGGVGALLAGAGYGISQLTSGPSTTQVLQQLANQADSAVPGNGPVAGTLKHSEFRRLVQGLGRADLSTEQSYRGGAWLPPGANTRGSVRLDVVEGPVTNPRAIYDLKTGSATLRPARIRQIQQHLPNSGIPIIEIRPH